ncbi:hypothetical protein Tco_0196450 [Tanacetum coccineum]
MEEEEDPEEDPEMEEEDEEMDVDADEEWDGLELRLPPIHTSILADHEPEAEVAYLALENKPPLTRLFANTQVWTGSSSSSAVVGHDPEDLTPSHIRSDLDALHRRVQQIENDGVRAENKRLRMIWYIEVQKHLPPHLHYQEAPYVLPSALRVPVTHNDPRDPYVAARDAATAPATDNDDPPTHEETSPSEPQGYSPRDS